MRQQLYPQELNAPWHYLQLDEMMKAQLMAAYSLNIAVKNAHGAYKFYMVTNDGAIEYRAFSSGETSLAYHFTGQPTFKVYLSLKRPGVVGYNSPSMKSCTAEFLTQLVQMLENATIAPYPAMPYGLLYPDSKQRIGIVFLTGENYSPSAHDKSRSNLGYDLQACVISKETLDVFPFLKHTDVASWLQGFYKACQQGVVELNLREEIFNSQPWYVQQENGRIKWILSYYHQVYRGWNAKTKRLADPPPRTYTEYPYEGPERDKAARFERWVTTD